MEQAYRVLVGIDWGTAEHEVCVLDEQGARKAARTFEHSGVGLERLADWLTELSAGQLADVAVAIETPRGAVVETLLERGVHVYSINPKQLDRFRDRHTVAGAKNDRLDAFVLADSLRADRKLYRRVKLGPARIVQLRELSRLEDELDTEWRRLCNQLRDALHRSYVAVLNLCPAADERWLWALVERAPTPEGGARLTKKQIERTLKDHRIRRLKAKDVLAALSEPPLRLAPGVAEGIAARLKALLPILRAVDEQRRTCARAIERLLDEEEKDEKSEHRDDLRILRSQPGLGRKGVAAMLSEAWEPLAARDYHGLRIRAGVAPVTSQTGKQGKVRGKKPKVTMRRACDARLREATHHWARVAVQVDTRARAHYDQLAAKGHKMGRSLRGVADRLLLRLVAMLRNRTAYDPNYKRTKDANVEALTDAA